MCTKVMTSPTSTLGAIAVDGMTDKQKQPHCNTCYVVRKSASWQRADYMYSTNNTFCKTG